MNLFAKLFPASFPELDWLQIGITTRCNASCIYCPQVEFDRSAFSADLSMEVFQALIPAFSSIKLVYLQGWGEPLMHPELFTMLKTVKDKGCLAGLTTNGTFLDTRRTRALVDTGLDFLSLSLAGVDQKNDTIRKNTRLSRVLQILEEIHRIRTASGTSSPRVHLAYLLLRSNLDDIPAMSRFFDSLDFDQVVISSLTLGFSTTMEKEMVLADSEYEFEIIKNQLAEMRDKTSHPEKIHFHLFNPYKPPGPCSENVLRSAYVDAQGFLKPCVCTDFSGLKTVPVKSAKAGGPFPSHRYNFGQILDHGLNHLWHSTQYRAFRRTWQAGKLPDGCRHCTKPYIDNLSC